MYSIQPPDSTINPNPVRQGHMRLDIEYVLGIEYVFYPLSFPRLTGSINIEDPISPSIVERWINLFEPIYYSINKNKHKNKTIVTYSDTAITYLRKAWDDHEICAISLEPIHPDSGGVLTACKHVFNAQFLYHLCSTQHSPTCPLCRTPIDLNVGGFTIRCTPFYRNPLAFFNTNSRFAKRRTRKRVGVCNTDIIAVNNVKQQSHNLK